MKIFDLNLSWPRVNARALSTQSLRELLLWVALVWVAYAYFVQDFGRIYPQHIRKAEELCANNDGIRSIYQSERELRDGNPVFTARIQCNNDALFLNAEFVDVIDNG